MSIFSPPKRSIAKLDPKARDDAMAALFAAGDRQLAARREAIIARAAYLLAVTTAHTAISTYRETAEEPFYTATSKLPGHPSLTAGEGYLAGNVIGAAALFYALRDQDKAEKNWRIEAERSRF